MGSARGGDYRLEVKLPVEFAPLRRLQGSVAVNGISLTVAEVFQKVSPP